ncbi:MAG: type II secretion system F family protein [Alphaproteobacteria bacterium]|nr:type II secretion system F family protein [Alphaproteobacteria bacterium]MBO5441675.1 type II secretion system F family protein [Alphaproteobacteria bacterium]MBP3687458.1 type II secretion system F family protein [Alphaproteobacteria bacterium]
MVKKDESSKSSFNKAMKSLGALEVSFAKFRVGMAGKARLKVYKKLASLLRNRFSLMNALDIMYGSITDNGKKTGEPMAIAIASWGKALQNGYAFSDALKGWAPSRERLMLSVGDMSDLESALLNLIRVAEGTDKMLKPIIGAIAYPSFLLLMSVLVIWAIGAYMVPPMEDAAPNARWTGSAKDLVGVSHWIKENWLVAFLFFPVLFTVIYATIGIWTGPTRRAIDDCPPWSLYKMFMGITWLLSLSALIKGGVPISVALASLRKDSNRYLQERIDRAMDFIKNGDNLGEALSKSKMNFPDKEIVADLRIYAELDNFEEALDKLANDWLDESAEAVEAKASILNMVAMFAISGIIAWAVFGVFEMQDQITSAMG